jgi:hypothetical protein
VYSQAGAGAPGAPGPQGGGVWQGQRSLPLLMGMADALTYNVQDVWSLVGKSLDKGELN